MDRFLKREPELFANLSRLSAVPGHRVQQPSARGDFSKWITNVFGDHPLAQTVQHLEEEYRTGGKPDVIPSLAEAIRSRYDFVDPLRPLHQ